MPQRPLIREPRFGYTRWYTTGYDFSTRAEAVALARRKPFGASHVYRVRHAGNKFTVDHAERISDREMAGVRYFNKRLSAEGR